MGGNGSVDEPGAVPEQEKSKRPAMYA